MNRLGASIAKRAIDFTVDRENIGASFTCGDVSLLIHVNHHISSDQYSNVVSRPITVARPIMIMTAPASILSIIAKSNWTEESPPANE